MGVSLWSLLRTEQSNIYNSMNKVVIAAAKRTPLGKFMGGLSTVSAPRLGAAAIQGVLVAARLKPEQVDEVFMGNVLQAGVGQAPARQAAIYAGIPRYGSLYNSQ